MTDTPNTPNTPIDYGEKHHVTAGYNGAGGFEIQQVEGDRLPGLPLSGQLPDMTAYIQHMKDNGYELQGAPPVANWQIQQSINPGSIVRHLTFRRADNTPTPAAVAMGLVSSKARAAADERIQAENEAAKARRNVQLAHQIRNRF